MRFLKLTIVIASVLLLAEAKDETKNRGKRQQLSFHPRRGTRPPTYAVQMEPIVQYSQRDPLYNSLALDKSDDGFYENLPQSYYPSEPEPIIEIIIKESNETLPTPVAPLPPAPRPTKEPIQVFYVKYEKKKNHSDGKSQVVYDAPIPALTPVEEHEKIQEPDPQEVVVQPATPAPTEPSTTLRAIIRPDSEQYHAPGSSGLRVTFGTDQVPPNNHNKRSDQEPPVQSSVPPSPIPPPGSSKKPHGPYQPLQPIPHRVPPAFPQQRIVNSIPPQQLLQHQQNPHLIQNQPLSTNPQLSTQNFHPQQFQPPLQNRNSQRPQRLPITIQGLPDFQQKLPFNANPHRINHPQQSFSGPHQNIHQPPALSHGNFNPDHQQNYKQQEEQKQKYYEQRRHQELLKQREQQRLAEQQRILDQQRILEQQRLEQQKIEQQRHQEQQQIDHQRQQEQQKYLEQQRLQELQRLQDQRRKQEQDQKLLQEQQYRQQIKYSQGQQFQQTPQVQKASGEILKAVPKLEQHYAIRENPLHPGPFPPNPQIQLQSSQKQTSDSRSQNNHFQHQEQQQQVQHQSQESHNLNYKPPQQSQQHFAQNSQTQKRVSSNHQSIWTRPAVQGNQKIYATPASHAEESSSPKSTLPPVTAPPTTQRTTTTTTTLSPKNEAKIKENIANLPDEVPDDIREQLLSSGILGNADIQILDYDKIGGIPIENLPPEALENFYSAGGAAATAASEPVPAIAKKPKTVEVPKAITTEIEQATLKPGGVEMKVVRFDPNTAQGQTIAGQHIREDATHLNPVIVGTKDDPQYNRYLPLKVSGASFPIPDVPELKGKKISSVVVLAPVDYNFKDGADDSDLRRSKKISDVQAIKFLAGDSLKQLVKKPTSENYKKWLEQEQQTPPQRQSVVLLVTTPKDKFSGHKEIFMYDVSSQSVSKLSGDLSTAFVDAAESNSDSPDSTDDSFSLY